MARAHFPFWIFGISAAVATLAPVAQADVFTADFTNSSYFDKANSTGVWNTTDAAIEAAVATGGAAGKEINFGDGSDGTFLNGPSQTGITVNGAAITINTDVKAVYQFTSFTLNSGNTVTVTGSQPLHILVLGAVTIAGAIHADGNPGMGNNGIAGNTALPGTPQTGPNPGGTGVAGGGSGGQGGDSNATLTSSTNGITGVGAGAPSVGGIRGTPVTCSSGVGCANDQGGGGGCNGTGPDAANDATASVGGGAAGTCASNRTTIGSNFETTFSGGAGGGGGGGLKNTNAGTLENESGGGGAGGGGAIHITALGGITTSGTISANGGTGGNNNSAGVVGDCGGGGGGGSGGSIWFQTAKALNGTSGALNVAAGVGGNDATCGAYFGGNGSRGVFRADYGSLTAMMTTTPLGIAQANTTSIPSGATYVVYSKPINLSTGFYSFSPPTETVLTSGACGNTGSVAVTYEASNDGTNFITSVTGANISQLDNSAFLRFKVTITTTGATPPCLSGLSIPYTLSDLSDLKLKGGFPFCGSMDSPNGGRRGGTASQAIGDLVFLAIALIGIRRIANLSIHPPRA